MQTLIESIRASIAASNLDKIKATNFIHSD